jgi:hypothetical protein
MSGRIQKNLSELSIQGPIKQKNTLHHHGKKNDNPKVLNKPQWHDGLHKKQQNK